MKSITMIRIAICTLALFIFADGNAQEAERSHAFGFGAEHTCSGNGHGGFYSLSLRYQTGRRTISAGPMLQARSSRITGAKITHIFQLLGERELTFKNREHFIELEMFNSVSFNGNLPLSFSVVQYEESLIRSDIYYIRDMKLSTLEFANGFALRLKMSDNWYTRFSFGASIYHHLDYKYLPDHAQTGVVMQVGASFSYMIR